VLWAVPGGAGVFPGGAGVFVPAGVGGTALPGILEVVALVAPLTVLADLPVGALPGYVAV